MAELTTTSHFETPTPDQRYLRDFVRDSRNDVALVEAIIRVLTHPNHKRLADTLREMLK